MSVRHTWPVVAASFLYASIVAAAPLDASTEKMVGFAASMTAMAQACKHMSANEIDTAKAKQRQAILAQGADAMAYDAAYDAAQAQFNQRWSTMSAAKQQSTCAEVKKQSEMAAAQANKMAK